MAIVHEINRTTMKKIIVLSVLFFSAINLFGQCKSVERFRKKFPESSNLFFYSSTLSMLNNQDNPELNDLLKDINKIVVLNYAKDKRQFTSGDLDELKENLKKEGYVDLMTIKNDKNDIRLTGRQKKGKMLGYVAFANTDQGLVIIDIDGTFDISKFMMLKNKLDI